MSTDLSTREFPDTANSGAVTWFLEHLRVRLRDAAEAVEFEATWHTWPSIKNAAQGLREKLTTDADLEGYKQQTMHRMAERMADFYPTPAHFPHAHDPERQRKAVALTVGGGLERGNSNVWGATYEEVVALYEAEYTNPDTPVASPDHEAETAYEQDMSNWDMLSAAVGGDLFENPAKLAAMREIDKGSAGEPWEVFHARVVNACEHIPRCASDYRCGTPTGA